MRDYTTIIRDRVARNVPSAFISTLESELRWGADIAWRNVMDPKGLRSAPRSQEHLDVELDRLIRNRRFAGCDAMMNAAKVHGIPYEYRSIGGGHRTAFVQFGAVVLCAEPIRYSEQRPGAATYKIDLARGNQDLLQLELPFPWASNRIDVRGVTFGIIQHLVPLVSLARQDCLIRDVKLVVPDSTFSDVLVSESISGDRFERAFTIADSCDEVARPQDDKARPTLRPRATKKRKDTFG
ncbi:MAG: hypothetical protein ACX93U_22810 [Salipiger thiooxidans]|uniref:hypothetical protein n=1 Tax=Salipiger thiooxidans TaxID=282683 RepID=UPI001CF9A905|nr:hypothetical protein [Salipiger thiooxidans]